MTGTGFFGKLPAQADFVGRGLPPALQVTLDDWLAGCLNRLQQRLGTGWVEPYLASPIWRFVWLPEACPPPLRGQAWAGVLLPSVDSVGRYFPLILLTSLPIQTGPVDLSAWLAWLDTLEQLGARALEQELQPDALMQALQALPPPSTHRLSTEGIDAMLATEAQAAWLREQAGNCLWHCAVEAYQACLFRCEGWDAAGIEGRLFGLEGLQDLPEEANVEKGAWIR